MDQHSVDAGIHDHKNHRSRTLLLGMLRYSASSNESVFGSRMLTSSWTSASRMQRQHHDILQDSQPAMQAKAELQETEEPIREPTNRFK